MFKATQTVIIKEGSIIPEEEAFVLEKSNEILSEIKERRAKWKKVVWLGNKPEYEWYCLGFSSNLRIGEEDVPVILVNHMGNKKYQEKEQFDVSIQKDEPRIVYNSVTGSSEAIASVIRKTREMYGPNAMFCIFRKRL